MDETCIDSSFDDDDDNNDDDDDDDDKDCSEKHYDNFVTLQRL